MDNPYGNKQLGIIKNLAIRNKSMVDDSEDLYGYLLLNYHKAIKSWNGSGKQISWAMWKTQKAVIDYLRKNGKHGRYGIERPVIIHTEDFFPNEENTSDFPDNIQMTIKEKNIPLSLKIKTIMPKMPLIDQYIYQMIFVERYTQNKVYEHILKCGTKETKGRYSFWLKRTLKRIKEMMQWINNVHNGHIESMPTFKLLSLEKEFKLPKTPLSKTIKMASFQESFSNVLKGKEKELQALGDNAYKGTLDEMKKALIDYALDKSEGNESEAARTIGVSRNTIRNHSNNK